MVKLICLDLDGTTIDDRHLISENNMKAIRKAQDAGIKVIVTTGRSFENAYKYAKEIANGFDSPIVCYNGASVQELQSGKQIFRKILKEKSVFKILRAAKKEKISGFAYLTKPYNAISISGGPIIKRAFKRIHLKNVTNEKCVKDSYKIILFTLFKSKANRSFLSLKSKLSRFEVTQSSYRSIEINSKGVSKLLGVKKLLEIWKIKPDEVAAIGDSLNDFKLMKKVKYSFAVQNAMPQLKEIAYKVLDSDNNNSPIAEAIDIILNKINK